jgi:hypothetical protein
MKQNHPHRNRHTEIVKAIFISLFIISSLALKAQTPTNFSGRWEFDRANSDKDERGDASFDGTIILEIKQNSDTITFSNTFFLPGKAGKTLRPDSYLTNGLETPDESGIDPAKKFVKWSPDKKILTTNYVMTATIDGVAQDFLTSKTYKLGEDGKTLVVDEFKKSKLNGEKTIKKVYLKK